LPDGSLDRKKMRRLIFTDLNARRKLEEITHPAVAAAIKRWLEDLRNRPTAPPVAVIEAALLFEAGLEELVDEVWVVIADPDTVVRRLMARDNIPPELAQAMLAAQMSQEEKIRRANRVIDNSGGFNHTRDQVAYFFRKITDEQ